MADTHHDVISKDPYLSRRIEKLKARALKEIVEREKLLQRLKEMHADLLGAAHRASRQLKERNYTHERDQMG